MKRHCVECKTHDKKIALREAFDRVDNHDLELIMEHQNYIQNLLAVAMVLLGFIAGLMIGMI